MAGYSGFLEAAYHAVQAGDAESIDRLAPNLAMSSIGTGDLDNIVHYLEKAACSTGLAPLACTLCINRIISSSVPCDSEGGGPARTAIAVAKHLAEAVARFRLSETARIVHAAARIIEQSYYLPWKLEEIASMMHISHYYFSRLFKREIGVTFLQYLSLARVRAAQSLLSDSSAQVKEIARQVGYADSRYFGAKFKRLVGVQPTQFKVSRVTGQIE